MRGQEGRRSVRAASANRLLHLSLRRRALLSPFFSCRTVSAISLATLFCRRRWLSCWKAFCRSPFRTTSRLPVWNVWPYAVHVLTDVPVHVSGGGGRFKFSLLLAHISAGDLSSGSEPLKFNAFPSMSFMLNGAGFDDVAEDWEVYRAVLKNVGELDTADNEGIACRRIAGVN